MSEKIEIDIERASRISRRVALREIILVDLKSKRQPLSIDSQLVHQVERECEGNRADASFINVTCSYSFRAVSGEDEVASAHVVYLLLYELDSEDPCDDEDLMHFAWANGTYNSWPFLRQLLFDLTARMGFSPFTLPVLYLGPGPQDSPVKKKKAAKKKKARSPAKRKRKQSST